MTNMMNNMPGTDSVPIGISAWLVCLLFVMGLIITGLKLVREFRGQPEAAAVQAEAADRYVTKAVCERYHQAMDARLEALMGQRAVDLQTGSASRKGIYVELECVRKEMVEMERRINKADEDRTTGLHDRLNEILGEVSEMRGMLKAKQS
jgi:hypothetical protein